MNRWLASLAAVALLGACSERKAPRAQGGLVIVLETDLSLPQDFDRVKLTVLQRDRILLSEEHAVGLGRLLIPAEFRAPSPGNEAPVVVRAVAYRGAEPRIERSAITPIPSSYLGLVRLPLNYLCDGTASSDGLSTCGSQSTCKQGSCRTSTVPAGQLAMAPASARAPRPDAGHSAVDPGDRCFDVMACFSGATEASVDLEDCSVPLPTSATRGQLNVALRLPAGSGGICSDTRCWVAWPRGDEGWSIDGDRIRLPEAVCRIQPAGRERVVVVSSSCQTWSASAPTCGDWSAAKVPIDSPALPPLLGDACSGPAAQPCGDCGTQTRVCTNGVWSGWSDCEGQGVCSFGVSQACGRDGTQLCAENCRFGPCTGQSCEGPAVQACGHCGTQSRTCDNGVWSGWSACASQGECSPDSTGACGEGGRRSCQGNCQWGPCLDQVCPGPASRSCGTCGTQTRSCLNGEWSAWSVCAGEGVCAANDTRVCGRGGTEVCGGNCQWTGRCLGQICEGPPTEPCGNCGVRSRTCDTSTGLMSAWSECTAQGECAPTTTRPCGNGGTQTCGRTCRWEAVCSGQPCPGPATESCYYCGTRSRVCDGNTGTFGPWSGCRNEGECHPDDTRVCGTGGRQVCDGSCRWSSACTNQPCPGAPSESCGNCGSRTRVCDSNTGAWGPWSECLGQGECKAPETRRCGQGGTQSCDGNCRWSATCSGQSCVGETVRGCERCGTQTRTCDPNTGTFGEWSTCGGQGACEPGTQEICGLDGPVGVVMTRACGVTCQWGPCTCPAGTISCGGGCSNPLTDERNCGRCGISCPPGASCFNGQCACAPPTQHCGGKCIRVDNDVNNCGRCGNRCREGELCVQGTCNCSPPFTACSSGCANLQSDPVNCGACGNACAFNTVCNAGQCVCPPGQLCATILARPKAPGGLTLAGPPSQTTVFFTDDAGGVHRIPPGGAPTTLATGESLLNGDIAIGGDFVVWAARGSLRRSSSVSLDPLTLASEARSDVQIIGADSAFVYYVTDANVVRRVNIAVRGDPVTISTGPIGSQITDGTYVGSSLYWINRGLEGDLPRAPDMRQSAAILEAPSGAMNPVRAFAKGLTISGAAPSQIAGDARYVYLSDGEVIGQANRPGTPMLQGELARGPGVVVDMASDGIHLYWATKEAIFKAKVGGPPQTPTPVITRARAIRSIAVDSTHVYWSERDPRGGLIARAPK